MGTYMSRMDELLARMPQKLQHPSFNFRMWFEGRSRLFYGYLRACRLPVRVPSYSDEYIEHWAEIFNREQLAAHGILFEVFLELPQDILDALQDSPLPLLPEQRAVRDRLEDLDQEQTYRAARDGNGIMDQVAAGGAQ